MKKLLLLIALISISTLATIVAMDPSSEIATAVTDKYCLLPV